VERSEKRKSGFLPFLAAILMAAALLALIGWQAGPWQNSTPPQTARNDDTEPAKTAGPEVTSPASNVSAAPTSAEPKPSALGPPPVEPKSTDDATGKLAPPEDIPKPVTQTVSPETAAKKGPVISQLARAVPSASQPVRFVTSPGGATVTLDGRADQSCSTPCQLNATPGRHTLGFTLPGYQIEHREVEVGGAPLDMPAVILHSQTGVLMLSSNPPGAAIQVNGKAVTEVTPARLTLTPGTYKITVEKNGLASVNTVEIKNGDTRLLKVTLGQ
jgi:serine/threonine-protein kinase